MSLSIASDLRQLIEYKQEVARPLLTDLVQRMPESVEARFLLGQSYLRSLDFEPALEHFRTAAALDPKHADSLQNIAVCHLAMGNYEGALEAYKVQFKATSQAIAATMMALVLHRLGRLAEAVSAYRNVLSACKPDSPEIPHALQGIIFALKDEGRPVTAERYVHELLQRFARMPQFVPSALAERNNSYDFHEWSIYAHKDGLAGLLMQLDAKGRAGLNFPRSFLLPAEREALLAFAKREQPRFLISKPRHGTGGQGIAITDSVSDVADRADVVVQEYIDRPYLVDGRKGHLRIYGLVTSAEPLRAYLYGEGIVRLAPEPYDLDRSQLNNVHKHVTNTALHLGHPDLFISDEPLQDDKGSIWSMSAYLKRMRDEGMAVGRVMDDMRLLVRKFLDAVRARGLFQRQMASSPRRAFPPKLFGLDVLIDIEGRPWLIEMQRKPAASGAAIINRINGQLFTTVFKMSIAHLLADDMPADRIVNSDNGQENLLAAELEAEAHNRGLFIPLQ
jgi:tetratricopeptide (TPR) repeat protein